MSPDRPEATFEAVLVRHAETAWSRDGRHTGMTDIPLSQEGRARARALAPRLACWSFRSVLVSPLERARETCELCGLAEGAEIVPDLHEWDYGEYDGLTTAQIHERRPDWVLWRDGCPGGESPDEVARRADRVVELLVAAESPVAVFSHGHMLRVLGARWIEQPPSLGARLALSTAALSVLAYERETRVLGRWNDTGEDARDGAGSAQTG